MGLFDFFKPDWKHSDPRVRQKSIDRVTDTEVLAEILDTDEDAGVKQTILVSLNTIPKMKEVLSKLKSDQKAVLDKQLQKAYFEESLKAGSLEEAHLSELNQHQLSRIARESKSEAVQKAAVENLSDESEISSVITHGDKKVAQLALSKITDREKLNKLEKSAKSKSVKSLIRKHYEDLFAEEDKAEEKRQTGIGRLEKIIKLLQGMATLPDWSKLQSDFEAQQSKWQENAEYASEELIDSYNAAVEKCNQSRQDYEEREAARLAKEKEVNDRMDRRRAVLQSINEAVEVLQADEESVLTDFNTSWEEIGEAEEAIEKEIASKFKKAVDSFSSKQAVLKDMAAKKDSVKSEIIAVIESGTVLQGNEDIEQVAKELKSLKGKLAANSKNLPEEFNALKEEADTKIAEIEDYLKKLREEEDAKLADIRAGYEALISEVTAIEEQSKETTSKVKELQAKWKELEKLPSKELDKLTIIFRKACDAYFDKVKDAIEERDWNQFANLTAKEKLITELEEIQKLEDPVELGKQLKEKQTAWKAIGPVPQDKADELWEKFKSLGDSLYERCKAHYAEQDEIRQKNAKAKEELCVKAEEISDSEEWKETAEALKALQAEWKEVGPAPRKEDKVLWDRFRAACDKFFNKRSEFFNERDSQRGENTEKKSALVAEIEKAAELENSKEAAAKIKELQIAWKAIGPAEREKENELWARFREVADGFFNRRRENYEKQQASFEENAKPKLELIASLKEKFESLADDTDWTTLSQLFRQSQKDFRDLPGAGFERDKELRAELKEICDKFFAARDEYYDQLSDADKENLNAKEEFCLKVELLAESSEWKDTAEELKKLQAEFKELPSINEKYDGIMYKRFNGICQTFFDRRREHFEEQDGKRQENLKKKESLCEQMEKIAGVTYSSASAGSASVADMAAQLQNAFDNNFGGHDTSASSPRSFKEASQEVRELQAAWKEIGPVPKAVSQKVWERFRKAADAFYAKRNEFFGDKKKDQQASLKEKQEILTELKKLAAEEETNFGAVKRLQKRWREAGDVPRENSKELNGEYRTVCDSIYKSSSDEQSSEEEEEVRI